MRIGKPPRMLVVDDSATIATALRKVFSNEGFEVDCATELEEAEAMIFTAHYDVIIADLRLTWTYVIEGLEVLRFVRHHSRDTHVVILTGHSDPKIAHAARDLGAEAFFEKPTPLPEIAETVRRLLESE